MTQFLDVRLDPIGGPLSSVVKLWQPASPTGFKSLPLDDLKKAIYGRDVLIATHGFNVPRDDGIACLSNWERLLNLPDTSVFLGLLWPGDSIWAHGLDYPEEPKIADEAAVNLVAPFINDNFNDAASISFASHSLGARLVLSTIQKMNRRVRRLNLMAGAIDDNCLNTEFKTAAENIDAISVLASKKDTVLSELFPLGNFAAGIIDEGHPWWRAAIGRQGPSKKWPDNFDSHFHIPDEWEFKHGDYLKVTSPPPAASVVLTTPVVLPSAGLPLPGGGAPGWQEAFTAGLEKQRFN